MSSLRAAGRLFDRASPWIAIGFIVVGFYVVHKQGQEIKEARANSIQLSCQEGNRRHKEAEPRIAVLIQKGKPPPDPAARAAQDEAVRALIGKRPPPTTAAGKRALSQVEAFVQLIAPAYDCKQRLAKFTKP